MRNPACDSFFDRVNLILDAVFSLFDEAFYPVFDLVNGAAGFTFVAVDLALDIVACGGGLVFYHVDLVVNEIAYHFAGLGTRTGCEKQCDGAADKCAGKEPSQHGAGITTSHNQNCFIWLNFYVSEPYPIQSYKFNSTNSHICNFYYFYGMTGELNTVVCFSGHRRYAAAPDDEERLFRAVEAAYGEGYRVFISGMAPGFDLAAAEAVVRLRNLLRGLDAGVLGSMSGSAADVAASLEEGVASSPGNGVLLVAAVPFAGQPREYSPADLVRYEALLAAADEVHVLSSRYSYGCYYRRDDWMVERSGRIICWYDGSRSGTRYTVRRAVATGLEVVNLFREPATLF